MTTTNKLSENQKKFSELLKALRLTKDSTITISLLLQKNNQMLTMAEFIKKNPMSTESEILEEAVRINEA